MNRNKASLKIRVVQEQIAANIERHLSAVPLRRPSCGVSRHFFLSPGCVQMDMTMDRAVVLYGERVGVSVAVHNTSNRTIHKIKVKSNK